MSRLPNPSQDLTASRDVAPVNPAACMPVTSTAEIGELTAYLRHRFVEADAEQAPEAAPATRALLRAVGGLLTSRTGFAHGLAAGHSQSPALHEALAPLYELAAQFPGCPLHWRRRAEEWMSGGPQ
ncbi:hypothetical protein AB0I77_42570 [Streptomyces sp. NPDC050619]|uniref:hypothetical protein n=1 Tax=Streptomyces sp. NPDC050619 TaxID=3157214 RepID=UPI0034297F32